MDQKLHDLYLYLKERGHATEANKVKGLIQGNPTTAQLESLAADYRKAGKFLEADVLANMLDHYAQLAPEDQEDTSAQIGEDLVGDQNKELTQLERKVSQIRKNLAKEWRTIEGNLKNSIIQTSKNLQLLIPELQQAEGTVEDPKVKKLLIAKQDEINELKVLMLEIPDNFSKIFKKVIEKLDVIDGPNK